MEYKSLVIMERDKKSKLFTKELGSYEIEHDKYITKLYSEDGYVYIYFDSGKDLDDFEYSLMYEVFDEETFENKDVELEFLEDEYNPTWSLKFKFIEDYNEMKNKLNEVLDLIDENMNDAYNKMEELKMVDKNKNES